MTSLQNYAIFGAVVSSLLALGFGPTIIVEKFHDSEAEKVKKMYEEMHPDIVPFDSFSKKFYKLTDLDGEPDYDKEISLRKVRKIFRIGTINYVGIFTNGNSKCCYVYTQDKDRHVMFRSGGTYIFTNTLTKIKFGLSDDMTRHSEYYRYCMMALARFSDKNMKRFKQKIKKEYKKFKNGQHF